jgi:AmmeMemoRadiSam system protein A
VNDVLPAIAIDAIEIALRDGVRRSPVLGTLAPELSAPAATFVTLEHDGALLGCVGSLEPREALASDVARNALAAAFDDPRVPPVTAVDFRRMSVKVSVLSPSSPLDVDGRATLLRRVRPGVDGLTIEIAPGQRATFLPSVWDKVDDTEAFLDALWVKAGIRPRTWPETMRVSRYTTQEFADPGPRDFRPSRGRRPLHTFGS